MSVWESLGGSRVVEGIARQLAAGEVAHAWLLAGPRGSGKRATATAMAAALDCTERPGEGCGKCTTCLRILRRRHPDVHHVVPEGPLIPVDAIRDSVISEAARSPFEARYQVFIVEEADRMNPPAQNALLKTLEEPEPQSILILVSERDEELLETILSRCRVVRLEPVPEERVVELLEQQGVPLEAALLAARLSEGDLQRAQALVSEEDTGARRRFWLSLARRLTSPGDALDAAAEVLDVVREGLKAHEALQKEEVRELADAMGEGRGTASARNALTKRHRRELRRLEEELLGEVFQTLGSFYRDVLAVRTQGEEAVTNLDLLDELRSWAASGIHDVDLTRAMERCVDARASLGFNANQTLAVESLLLDLARLVPGQARVGAGADH